MSPRILFPICFAASVVATTMVTSSMAVSPNSAGSHSPARVSLDELLEASPVDPAKVLGNEACVKCHASEIKVWQNTPHARTFDELHRRPEAKTIAKNLGLRSIKHEGRCVACHYTQQADAGRNHAIAGVSCESCHGAAKDWVDVHQDYGGEHVTRQTESHEHKLARLQASISAGMRNPHNVYLVAQSCYRCHTTADEELINVGGHSAGSLDFEIVAWSQGTVRHNFVRTDGKVNQPSTPQQLRVLFVAGMMADLEASLRATANATQKAKFGITVAQRADRAGKRLKSVAAKIDDKYVSAAVQVYESVQLKLNNSAPLIDAAEKVAKLGYLFAMKNDGSGLSVLDTFIPPADRRK